jgi:hypothetical protein
MDAIPESVRPFWPDGACEQNRRKNDKGLVHSGAGLPGVDEYGFSPVRNPRDAGLIALPLKNQPGNFVRMRGMTK